jgi:mannosyltransferase
VLAVLIVIAAVVRFARIGHQSFWYDESFTAVLVHHSPSAMLGLLPRTELTPPLYYCVAWVWARIFGFGEAGLRSLSALAGVATVPAVYGLGARLVSRRAGLIAAALAACNPLLIWYSQEARSYALLVLLATLSLLAFAHVRSEPTPRRLGAWALAASLTLATHYYGALAVAPAAIWLLWIHRRDRRVLLAVGVVGAFGLALLPIALSQRPHASWITGWPLNQRLSQIPPQFLLGTGAPARTWLKLAGFAAMLLAATLLARRADDHERRGALVAGALALSGFLLSLVLILAGIDELITRNLLVLLIPLIALIAGGLGARRAGALGLVGAATLCTVGLVAAIGVAVDQDLQRPDWRAVARAIGTQRPALAERAIVLQHENELLPLGLDMPGLRFFDRRRGALVSELDVIAAKRTHGWFCWWGSACNLAPTPLDTAVHIRGFHPFGPVLQVGKFSILRLRSVRPVRLTAREISRGLTKTGLYSDGLLIQPPA